MLRSIIAVTSAGTTGAAIGTTTNTPYYEGELHAVYVEYAATMTATTTARLSLADPSLALLTLTATAGGWFFPRLVSSSNAGAAQPATAGVFAYPVTGHLVGTVATAAPATDACKFTVYIKEN